MKIVKRQAFFAGCLIGLSMVLWVLGKQSAQEGDVWLKLVAGAVFAFALCFIKEQGLPLFTGLAGSGKIGVKPLFCVVLPLNLLGTAVPFLGAMALDNAELIELMRNWLSVAPKALPTLFVKAVLCGVLMRVACATKSTYVTVGAVAVFLFSGYAHCIALGTVLIWGSLLGDPQTLPWNMLCLLVAIAGNAVGGYGTGWALRNNKVVTE